MVSLILNDVLTMSCELCYSLSDNLPTGGERQEKIPNDCDKFVLGFQLTLVKLSERMFRVSPVPCAAFSLVFSLLLLIG